MKKSDYRAAQRMGQGNPAFQAQLNAQNMLLIKSGTDEFRMNQSKKKISVFTKQSHE
jgi:hypothetical protein